MSATSDVKKLRRSLQSLRERVATLEGAKSAASVTQGGTSALAISLIGVIGVALVGYLGWVGMTLVTLSNKVAVMDTLLAPQHLTAAAANPNQIKNVKQAEKIIKMAIATKQTIDSAAVREAGTRFIDASGGDPAAWNVSLQLVDYRSLLNATSVPIIGGTVPATHAFQMNLQVFPLGNHFPNKSRVMSVECHDSADGKGDDARFGLLDHPDQGETGCRWITIEGSQDDGYVLHNVYMKNVIVKDAVFQYNGGPVRLENVYFVNGRFLMMSSPATRSFGKSLLQAQSTSFDKTAVSKT